MALANRFRASLLDQLRSIDVRFPFEDRVLVWLGPEWLHDVDAYHHSKGRPLTQQFSEHQLDHFDEAYEQELRIRLDGL